MSDLGNGVGGGGLRADVGGEGHAQGLPDLPVRGCGDLPSQSIDGPAFLPTSLHRSDHRRRKSFASVRNRTLNHFRLEPTHSQALFHRLTSLDGREGSFELIESK